MTAAEHTRVFVLDLPPYASIHLGAEGQLGGEAADRVAGMWRALGLDPPAEPDHLAALLGLSAELRHGAAVSRTPAARERLQHARRALHAEHLTSWMGSYLAAVAAYPAAASWAALCRTVLREERRPLAGPDTALPVALRDAPEPLADTAELDGLLDALVAPIRTGFVLTHTDLQRAGDHLGLGVRRGERRYTLRAMLDQDRPAILGWLAAHARSWAVTHQLDPLDEHVSAWWSTRAAQSARVLDSLAAQAAAV
jgi:hypothetical protein